MANSCPMCRYRRASVAMDEEDSLANALELDAAAKAFYENRDRTDMFCRDCLAERDAVLAEVG